MSISNYCVSPEQSLIKFETKVEGMDFVKNQGSKWGFVNNSQNGMYFSKGANFFTLLSD